jgi:hypothetical protein
MIFYVTFTIMRDLFYHRGNHNNTPESGKNLQGTEFSARSSGANIHRGPSHVPFRAVGSDHLSGNILLIFCFF